MTTASRAPAIAALAILGSVTVWIGIAAPDAPATPAAAVDTQVAEFQASLLSHPNWVVADFLTADTATRRARYAAWSDYSRRGRREVVAFLAALSRRLGSAAVLQLVTDSRPHAAAGADRWLEAGVLASARDLFADRHDRLIRQTAWAHGIRGDRADTPWPPTELPATAHPYADDADVAHTHTIAGVRGLRVTFDPTCRLHWTEGRRDVATIRDRDGRSIVGSPFIADQLAGRTVEVSGDAVTVRVRSLAGDGRAATGIRVISVAPAGEPNEAPSAELRATVLGSDTARIVRFDASASRDLDGRLIVFRVDPDQPPSFADPRVGPPWSSRDLFLDPERPIAEQLYLVDPDQPPTITATLTVTDDGGATATTSISISLRP